MGLNSNGEPVVIAPYVEERYISADYVREWVEEPDAQRIIDTYLDPNNPELYVGRAYVLAKGDPKPGETAYDNGNTEHGECKIN